MKKKLVIIVVAIGIIVLGYIMWQMFIRDFIRDLQRNNNRINNSKTLSQYVEYHKWLYTDYTENYSQALDFHSEDIKCNLLNEKRILYYDNEGIDFDIGLLILDDYTIYETAFNNDKVYSNEQQYKQIETDIKIKQIKILFGKPYFISEDNRCYELSDKKLKELEEQYMGWYTFEKTSTLLKDKHIKKVISSRLDNVIVIKDDGQVYSQEYKIGSTGNKDCYLLRNETLLLSNKEYGNIIDCEYGQNDGNKSEITKIVSDKGLYYLKKTSEQEYIDTEATYELVLSDIYNKYKTDIIFIDCKYIFTTDNNIIRTEMLCREIDKEVK